MIKPDVSYANQLREWRNFNNIHLPHYFYIWSFPRLIYRLSWNLKDQETLLNYRKHPLPLKIIEIVNKKNYFRYSLNQFSQYYNLYIFRKIYLLVQYADHWPIQNAVLDRQLVKSYNSLCIWCAHQVAIYEWKIRKCFDSVCRDWINNLKYILEINMNNMILREKFRTKLWK